MLTNYHVLEVLIKAPARASTWSFRFDHRLTPEGVEITTGRAVSLSSDWLLDHAPFSSFDLVPEPADDPNTDELDFALVRLAEPVGAMGVGVRTDSEQLRGWVELAPDATATSPCLLVILQHPLGRPLKLALSQH